MEVKGAAVAAIPSFIHEKFGEAGFDQWLRAISSEANKVYESPVLVGTWYSLKAVAIDPVAKACELFYFGNLRGAWDFGRFTAEYGLKGVFAMFVDPESPEVLIERGGIIISAYFNPSPVLAIESSEGHALVKIKEFPEVDELLELYVGGWIERALEMSGCEDVRVKITSSLSKGDPSTGCG